MEDCWFYCPHSIDEGAERTERASDLDDVARLVDCSARITTHMPHHCLRLFSLGTDPSSYERSKLQMGGSERVKGV